MNGTPSRKWNICVLLLFALLFANSKLAAQPPEMWASISSRQIPNRSPAGNRIHGLTFVLTILNPSKKVMFFDVSDCFRVRVLDAKKNAVKHDWIADASFAPTMRDVVQLNPGFAYSLAYNLPFRNGVLRLEDGTGGRHQFVLPKPGKYTVEVAFESNPVANPMVSDFENSNYQSLIKEFYRGPIKLGKFKIQVSDLNKERAKE